MSRHVSCIPSSDETFKADASAAFAQIDGDRLAAVEQLLADLLRPTYPAVAVHRQAVLARMLGDDVWYVYRDGRAVSGTESDPSE
jgi:hypothetical protein